MSSVQEFNNNLVNNLSKIDLNDYFNEYHSKFDKNIDISFMDEFLSMVENEDICYINGNKLRDYGVINAKKFKSGHIKECLETHNLIENVDYEVRPNVRQNPNGGRRYYKAI